MTKVSLLLCWLGLVWCFRTGLARFYFYLPFSRCDEVQETAVSPYCFKLPSKISRASA
jgi:hypothetical protein